MKSTCRHMRAPRAVHSVTALWYVVALMSLIHSVWAELHVKPDGESIARVHNTQIVSIHVLMRIETV